ncbi:Solute carrier family 25 member 35 [Merluccius polli]|uniref:Solute carrier family 25 member 35 n=1 Tax=Merluccius polli TaxID=89951 RepID=A0AA47M375_MERPO|nr:Solute carrier family 25 member 35 [Merluccius polli]
MHLSKTSFTKHSEIHEPILIHRLALQPLELNVAQEEHAVPEALQSLGLQVLEQQLFTLLEQVAAEVFVVLLHSGDGLLVQEAAEGLCRGLIVLVDYSLGLLRSVLLLGCVIVFHVFPQLPCILVLLKQPLADGLRDAHALEHRVHGGFHLLAIPYVKTHLQSQATSSIAVGHQYQHRGMVHALVAICRQHGFMGLWRGAFAAVPRTSVGSAAQLTSFSTVKEMVVDLQVFSKNSWLVSLSAGMVTSVVVVFAMTPFDVVSTRLYNQPVDHMGKGLLYRSYVDCFSKTMRTEGMMGLYKGLGASYFRLGPHTILSLFFWDELRKLYQSHR